MWIAIILGFILVAMAITIIPSSLPGHHGRSPKELKERREHEKRAQEDLARIRTGVDELRTKVDSIERMLLEVQ